MKLRLAAAAFALALSAPAFGQETYNIDPNHTMPTFEVGHGGISLQRGSFAKATGKVTLDRAGKKGTIDVTIDTSTINTNHAARDGVLKSERFFDVAKYPTMTFKSNSLKFDGENVVGADGELTMLGVTKPVALAVTHFNCGPSPFNKAITICGAEVTTSIKRSEWGMKSGIPLMQGDDVRIAIPVEAVKE
jgi:polyisoprenoid-binding protein YceI